MSVALRGNGILHIHSSTWAAVEDIAREFGCTLQYTNRGDEERRPAGDYGEYVLEDSARAFAKALYRAIREIETGRPSKRLLKIAMRAQVGNLRAIADLAVGGYLYVD